MRRFLSLTLVLVLLFSLFSVSAFAIDDNGTPGEGIVGNDGGENGGENGGEGGGENGDENANEIVYEAQLYEGEDFAAQNMQTIRSAFDLAEEGKSLTVKIAQPGTYYVGDGRRAWRMRSETVFDLNGATVIRYGSQGNILQNADYTGENATQGGYTLTKNITIKNGTIDGAPVSGSANVCNIGHADGVHFEDMNIRNGNAHLIEFSGCRNCTVTNCTFTGYATGRNEPVEAIQFDICDNDVSKTAWNGVFFSDSTPCRNITVDNCTFYNYPTGLGNHKGIKDNHNTGIVVKNCKFLNTLNTTQPAAWFYDFDNSEFSGNTITGNYGVGLNVSGCRNSVFKDNTIKLTDCTTGMYFTVANSYVRGTEKDVHTTDTCVKLTVTCNNVDVGGKNVGVRVFSNSGISDFNNNTIKTTGTHGMIVTGSSLVSNLNNNAITCSGSAAMTVNSSGKVTNFKNNTLSAPAGIGMLVATSGSVGDINGNKITSKTYAMQISSDAKVNTIRNNPTVTAKDTDGIFVTSATATSVTGNTIKNCGGSGLRVTSTGTVKTIQSNTVTGCKEYGVWVTNTGLSVLFYGNTFSANKSGAYKVSAKIMLPAPKISSLTNAYSGVGIKWAKITGAPKYRVLFKSGTAWKVLGDTTATSFTDTKAVSGQTRTYSIRCITADGKTYKSGLDATGKSLYYVAAPRLSNIQNLSGATELRWKTVKGISKYRVLVKSGKSAWKTAATVTGTSYKYKGVKGGTAYTYTLRGLNAKGQYVGAYNTAGWKYTYIAPPALPTLQNTSSGVKLTFKKPAGATRIRILRKVGSGKWAKLADTTSTSYVDKTAKKGVKYTYTLRVTDKAGKQFLSYYNTAGRAIICKR